MTRDAAAGPARPPRPLVLDADGGTAPLVDTEPLGERRAPRIPTRLLAAALVGALLLTGSALGTRAATDVEPSAFAIFDAPASDADRRAQVDLEGFGAPMIGEARVLATEGESTVVVVRAPQGSRDRLRETGGFPPSGGPVVADPVQRGGEAPAPPPVPASAEVCLWMLGPLSAPSGRCATADDFVRHGIAASAVAETLEVAAHWGPGGATTVELVPRGPTTLEELRALSIPAIEQLESLPRDPDAERASLSLFTGDGGDEVVIPARQVAASDEWRMIVSVVEPQAGAGLVACVTVRALDDSLSAGGGCTAISTLAATGIEGGLGINGRTISWQWSADGAASFDVDER